MRRTRPAFDPYADELRSFGIKTGLDGDALAQTSRLTARIDNNAVADGFQLYLHSFVITKSGEWAVVQQGMNSQDRSARRYHWHSRTVRDFVSDPHNAIVGKPQGDTLRVEIGPVQGGYPGMPRTRGFELRLAADWPPVSITINGLVVKHPQIHRQGGLVLRGQYADYEDPRAQ